jgi:predicted amidohydrolase YtcJ
VRELLHPAALAESEAYLRRLEGEGGFTVPERLLRKMMQWERAFVAAGGLLASGSDPWGSGLMPGIGNLRNYELLREAGFGAEEVVKIMTLNGATILGEADRVGSVEVGKAADLFVVRGDPAARPAAIYDVAHVFRGGIGYDPAKLLAFAQGKVGAP